MQSLRDFMYFNILRRRVLFVTKYINCYYLTISSVIVFHQMPENSSEFQKQKGVKKYKMINTKIENEETNPCTKEANISLKCLENNFYQRDECKKEFDNYNECKKFWGRVRFQRRIKGISPILPSKGEREKILEMRERKGIDTYSAQ